MARLHRLVANLGVSVLTFLVLALLLEAAVRGFAARAAGALGVEGTPISRYHSTLGWDKPPGGWQRLRRPEYQVEIRINAKGLRGPERDYARAAGTKRVLLLGDSFAEGYYAAEEQTARAVLEKSLRDECGPAEVLNGGTAGYSTDQEYLFFRDEGSRYRPDLVVMFFYYNDVYYNTSAIGTAFKPKPYFELEGESLVLRNVPVPPSEPSVAPEAEGRLRPWRGSLALRLLSNRTAEGNPRLHRFLARFGLVEPVSSEPPAEMTPYGPGGPVMRAMWARTIAILKALKAEVEEQGGRLVILYVPSRFELTGKAWDLTSDRYKWSRRWGRKNVVDRLKMACDEMGVPLVDPREALKNAETSSSPAYFPRDGHWNEVGNGVAARELLPQAFTALGCPADPR